eukprot:4235321-Amphidinium_carterae.1
MDATRRTHRLASRWWDWAGHCGRLLAARGCTLQWYDLSATQTRRALGGSLELRVGQDRRWERQLVDVLGGP